MKRSLIDRNKIDKNTLLLLHFDGNYTDYSIYKRNPISVNNISYASGKYGQSLSVLSLNTYIKYSKTWFVNLFNTGIYTIDFWSKNTSDWNSFFGVDNGSTSAFVCRSGSTHFEYGIYDNPIIYLDYQGLTNGLFRHYAIVSDGNKVHLYINGVLQISSPIKKVSFPNVDLTIGGRVINTSGVRNVNYIDEFRISSVVRWTSNFTPSTKPY